ncbi:transposase [Caloramator sp. ALD01]|uniref:transposase n=1 Tax=Caloramator sp. ALD01 TaxID=1031288 RepID=UPI0003F9DCC1|nr:transposase [Caloramator sp. ALD01]
MSNRERGYFEGAIHHVWQKGNNNEYIFKDPKVKQFFIKQLKEYKKKFDYNLFAYVIMDNHYHLLIQTFNNNIGEVMFHINNVTSKFIRDYLGYTGHIFKGRYNSKLVETDEYFLWLIRYIHRNPIRAGICSNVSSYKWSSHFFYVKGYSNFVNVTFPLSLLNSNKSKSIELYLNLMNINGNEKTLDDDFKFISKNFSFFKPENVHEDIKFEIPRRPSLQEILDSFKLPDEDIILLKSGSRRRNLTPIKLELIKKAINEKYTLTEIASFLNVSQTAISNILYRSSNK